MTAVLWLLAMWSVLGADARAQEPDLIVDSARMNSSWGVDWKFIPPDHCAIVEGCVGGSGYRKLLRFSTETANIGMGDLVLGDPAQNPLFEFSSCHGHFHFGEYSDHQLLDGSGNPVVPGLKTGFCLLDSFRYVNEEWVPRLPSFNCSFQGLQRGWSDLYGSHLDCQWIDVTDVPIGNYQLQVTVNPEGRLPESDPANNSAVAAVLIGEPEGISHRPDGKFTPGTPLQVAPDGANVRVTYDITTCPGQDYNLYYGDGPSLTSRQYLGGFCNLGVDGEESVAMPDPAPGNFLWFVVVGRQGTTEGGHGFDSAGVMRALTGVGQCGIFNFDVTLLCL